jgi:hypothetical protein
MNRVEWASLFLRYLLRFAALQAITLEPTRNEVHGGGAPRNCIFIRLLVIT